MSKHIAAIRNNEYLGYDATASTLHLSLDHGSTWGEGMLLNESITIITFAHIFASGNILFCSDDAAYVSTDGLKTYRLSTVHDVDGNPFVATSQAFRAMTGNYHNYADYELLVWGCYATINVTWYTNVNAWYTTDDGLTIKSFWKVNYSLVDGVKLKAKHIHAINRCYVDGSWWMLTGDGTDEVHTVKFMYNRSTDTWLGTKIAGDNLPSSTDNTSMCVFKAVGVYFYNGYVYWCCDTNPDPDNWGIWRCKISEYGDKTKITRLFEFGYEGWGIIGDGPKILCIERARDNNDKKIAISKDGETFEYANATGGLNFYNTYMTFFSTRGPDDRGYFRLDQMSIGEQINNFTGGEVLLIKIR